MELLKLIFHRLDKLAANTPGRKNRFLTTREAAAYCGFSDVDPQCRGFLRFIKEEGLSWKRGNTASQRIFDVTKLDRVMTSKLEQF